ncbi:NAD-dependent epimerase/dehydratase family protein [Pedococcus bigeumensis]|uniref:NAD(P)-dependent oxidoreductase n=1 Tax=Pedococcus bigeumensis TaxID=433644 RepID=A0A502D0Y6_9MICO|nr:NAD(P)-dependent oxidoreductase [Pedococcus bigeumensis]TPG19197.1 NAD(P)-dependent oxidoreductase [Pedococcus bigeumensis]
MTPASPLTWVVGSGGLLGSHLVRSEAARGRPIWAPGPIPWSAQDAPQILHDHARAFVRAAGAGPWQVLWSAGAGVTGASKESLDDELRVFEAALDGLSEPSAPMQGAVFFASSAGGLYGGSKNPPFDETTPVSPLAPYGRAKLAAETRLREWGAATGVSVLCGRIANLYGPGQNLAKPQGLISQMLKAQLTAQPLSIYVSLDTLRDYIYTPDAAELVADAMDRLRTEQAAAGAPLDVTKVLASLRPVTIGEIIGEVRLISKRRPRIGLAASPVAAFQARNLSLRSVVWTELDHRPRTPLAVGIQRTAADLQLRWQRTGGLTA